MIYAFLSGIQYGMNNDRTRGIWFRKSKVNQWVFDRARSFSERRTTNPITNLP